MPLVYNESARKKSAEFAPHAANQNYQLPLTSPHLAPAIRLC
jgi:hypothetical protein